MPGRLRGVEDPKRQAWMYLVAGVLAVIAGIYFISTAGQQANDQFGLLDYVILGMGAVAIYRGVRGFLALRNGDAGSAGAKPAAGPKRISRPGSAKDEPGDSGPGDDA